MPEPTRWFLLIIVWMAGGRNAIVFPVPVFACARQSILFARRSWRVAACTGIIWSNLRSSVIVLIRIGCSKDSFARSANRGVSRGTGAVRGGVETRIGGAAGADADASVLIAFRGAAFVPMAFLPLYGCRLAGFFLDSIVIVMRFRRSGLRLNAERENM